MLELTVAKNAMITSQITKNTNTTLNLAHYENYYQVPKLWGREYWLVNNDQYCAKFLLIQPHSKCSFHRHHIKTETFIVISGRVKLRVQHLNGAEEILYLCEGESYTLQPGMFHQFSSSNAEPAMILEVSSHHSDADVQRLEESSLCKN